MIWMAKIHELLDEIDDLNKKIEDEDKNLSIRKSERNSRIRELEESKKRAAHHKDPLSVQKFETQIRRLKNQSNSSNKEKFLLEIKACQREISYNITEYYKNNHTINDIFEIENTPKDIQEKLLMESNFGLNTGYLFVDETEEDEYNWEYRNPFLNFKIISSTLDDLESKLRKKREQLIEFDEELAKKSKNRDSIIYQKKINEYLNDLNISYYSYSTLPVFKNLKKFANKFNEEQITELCNFFNEDFDYKYRYLDDFQYILKANECRFDESFYDDVYKKLIDKGLNSLSNLHYSPISLSGLGENFTKEQIDKYYNYVIEHHYKNFDDFDNILKLNEDNFDESSFEKYYQEIIDNGIDLLNDSATLYESNIFNSFKICAEKFNVSQVNSLYEYIFYQSNYKFLCDFDYILKANGEEYIDMFFEKSYNEILNDCKSTDLDYSGNVFNYLNSNSDRLSEEQINNLIETISKNNQLSGFADGFINFLECNEEKINIPTDIIHNDIIEGRLEFLNNINTCKNVSKIIDDLSYFTESFNEKQLNLLIKIIVHNNNVYGFAFDFKKFLSQIKNKFDISISEICSKIVNQKTIFLMENKTQPICPDVFDDLRVYSNYFDEKSIERFYDASKKKNYIEYYPEIVYEILSSNNKYLNIDDELVNMEIDMKLKELKELHFGYPTAKKILQNLEINADKFTEDQINRLCEISISNKQVYDCHICRDSLRSILNENKGIVDEGLYNRVFEKNNL